jgi:hypothetical protein
MPTTPTDRELELQFDHRYAGIDHEIPPTPAFESAVRRRTRGKVAGALAALVVAALVLVVAVPLLGMPATVRPNASQPTDATDQPRPSFMPIPDATFPSDVGGLRVITVARAAELLKAGKLDGRAVAVAGFYDASYPSCPMPNRYVAPLERWCDFSSFADTLEGARLCTYTANGSTCRQPTGTFLSPFLMPETSGALPDIFGGIDTADPLPMVLIGHAGDPRQWACDEQAQAECAGAFVVDRVAWALGREVPVTPPATYDQQSYAPLAPSMRLDQLSATLQVPRTLGLDMITASVFKARDIALIDPRFPMGGEGLVWLVRGLLTGPVVMPLTSDPSGEEWLSLVDDATGKVIAEGPMPVDPDYQPARVWPMATLHGFGCCGGDRYAFLRVESAAGTVVHEGILSTSSTGDGDTTSFGGGYRSSLLVLPAGTYTVDAWVASYLGGVMGRVDQLCSATLTFDALESTAFLADFPSGKPCTLGEAPAPTRAP